MLRSWGLKMELQFKSGQAIYMQITQKIIEEIKLGRLPASTTMPGSRYLASDLGVNRRTVVLAYDELIAQGWLCTEYRRGTFVSENIPGMLISHERSGIDNVLALKAFDALNLDQDIYCDNSTTKLIEFNDGIPDSRLIPFEVLSRAFRHALVYSARSKRLGYDNPRGQLELRKSISVMLNMERGLHVDVNQICIVRGSQMGIFLVARILINKNDNVVFEHLTYPPAREAFKSCGANILTVGVDEHGINVDEIELLCLKNKIKAVYVTPQHQFPTTVMMLAERRLKLLLLAEQYDFAILEDDYDHEFHFSHHPMLPLASTDRSQRVIYIGSLSKVLAPGLRVGYIAASPAFIDRCAAEIMLIDRQGNSVTELAVSELMNKGVLKHHIRKTLKIYNQRRVLLAKLLQEKLPNVIDFCTPSGGLAFWLNLKFDLDVDKLVDRFMEEKIRISPDAIFVQENNNYKAIRLGFGTLDFDEIINVVQSLKRILAN